MSAVKRPEVTTIGREKLDEINALGGERESAVVAARSAKKDAAEAETRLAAVLQRDPEFDRASAGTIVSFVTYVVLRAVLLAVDYHGYSQFTEFAGRHLGIESEAWYLAALLAVITFVLAESVRHALARVRNDALARARAFRFKVAGVGVSLLPVVILSSLALVARSAGEAADLQGMLLWGVAAHYWVLAGAMFIACGLLIFGGADSDHALPYLWFACVRCPLARRGERRAAGVVDALDVHLRHVEQAIESKLDEFEHEYGWRPRSPLATIETMEYANRNYVVVEQREVSSAEAAVLVDDLLNK